MWAGIFVILSILMFIPFLQDKDLVQFIIYWILLIPLTLLVAKWYFKQDSPTVKKGILAGLVVLTVICILDFVISVFFVKFSDFFYGNIYFYTQFILFIKIYDLCSGNPYLYVGFVELLALTAFAGYEFDSTYTKTIEDKHE
jgi:hypothetical protein